jgi:hypothetical protein
MTEILAPILENVPKMNHAELRFHFHSVEYGNVFDAIRHRMKNEGVTSRDGSTYIEKWFRIPNRIE